MGCPHQALIQSSWEIPPLSPAQVLTKIPKDNYNLLSGLPILSLPLLQFIVHAGATQCGYTSESVTCLFKKPSYQRSGRLRHKLELNEPGSIPSLASYKLVVLGQVPQVLCLRSLHLWSGKDISTSFFWLLTGINEVMPIKCQDLAIESSVNVRCCYFQYSHHPPHGLAGYLRKIIQALFLSSAQWSDPCLPL